MKLLDSYFRIISHSETDGQHVFSVQMLPDHPVYQGHFPGNPVSPGVCNMQMLKECAEVALGQSTDLVEVKQYRLMGVITPQKTPRLTITVKLTPSEPVTVQSAKGQIEQNMVTLTANVTADGTSYIDFKGTLVYGIDSRVYLAR